MFFLRNRRENDEPADLALVDSASLSPLYLRLEGALSVSSMTVAKETLLLMVVSLSAKEDGCLLVVVIAFSSQTPQIPHQSLSASHVFDRGTD